MLFALSFLATAEPTLNVKPIEAIYTRPQKIKIEASLSDNAQANFYYAYDNEGYAENDLQKIGTGNSVEGQIDLPAVDNRYFNNVQAKLYIYARDHDKVYKSNAFYITIKSENPPRLLGAGIGNKLTNNNQESLVCYVEPAFYKKGTETPETGRHYIVEYSFDHQTWQPVSSYSLTSVNPLQPYAFYVPINQLAAGQHDLFVRIKEVSGDSGTPQTLDYSDEIPLTFRIQH